MSYSYIARISLKVST